MGKKKTFYTRKKAEKMMEEYGAIMHEYWRCATPGISHDDDKAKIYYKALRNYQEARRAYNKIMNRVSARRRMVRRIKRKLEALWSFITGIIKQLGGNNDKQKRTEGAHGKEEGVR